MTKILLLLSFTVTLLFSANGAELINKNCATCHMLTSPTFDMIPTLKAPAMDAVVFHLKDDMKDEKKMKAFIVDYALNPSASKSVCESNKVQKYGVMPSLKGKILQTDLESIAEYMLKTYPHANFVKMIKEILINDKMNALQNSPFLINSEALPHMTKILIQNWDKAKLNLNAEQKNKLLVVRKKTMDGVKNIKQQLKILEDEIAEAMIDREEPFMIEKKVEEVAKLKVQATKIHLKCISDTTAILSDEQVAFLLPFWE